ncbi:hypothetical protein SAMN05428987_4946 [Paenibacillus sp. CF095]|uniref:hypothetical protein n=1 Tax=Paenibacillus sp. CF095 TaxID=1881033 RepID=UPI00087E7B30|nr:hypothetical protein [Paenibacillus sp. CF095]SDD48929.1 hypothetical protein SAMN05428987_4946 [Paenibacillus sp. CF095]
MSKKDQFKKLLGDSGTTGSDQKNRILNDTLISGNNSLRPVSDENKHSSADSDISTISPAEEQPKQVTQQPPIQQESLPVEQQPLVEQYQQPVQQDPAKELIQQEIQEAKQNNEQAPVSSHPQVSAVNGISSIISSLSNTVDLKVEETHTRKTYLIENELLAELDKLCVGKKKGYKTKMINSGLRIVLELVNENKEFKL